MSTSNQKTFNQGSNTQIHQMFTLFKSDSLNEILLRILATDKSQIKTGTKFEQVTGLGSEAFDMPHASFLFSQDIDIMYVSKRLGHDSIPNYSKLLS